MARKTNTKDRILEVAEELFAQRGFTATSITDIADQVGIRGPGVYKHYNSKLDIYEAVLERLFEAMAVNMTKMSTDSTPSEIQHQIGIVLHYHAIHPHVSRITQQATMTGGEILQLLVDKWYKPFIQFVRDLAEDETHSWISTQGIMALHSILLGYVTLAPLHQKLLNIDPLSEEMISEQVAFYQQMTRALSNNTGAS